MKTVQDRFNAINTFEDLQPLVAETEDGESPVLEFKSLAKDSFNSENKGETKAILAKEISAFLNTNDGLIVWGGDVDKQNKLALISNDSAENLEDFFDGISQTIVEPAPRGINFKTIQNKDGKTCLLIYVPRSDFAPHRVGTWDAKEGKKGKDKKIGRYFQRVGTNSQAMPENMVRAMYLSMGRVPKISIHTTIGVSKGGHLSLTTFANPDPQKYVAEYHNSNQIAIMNDSFQFLRGDDNEIWREIYDGISPLRNSPIYPKDSEYELMSAQILPDLGIDQYSYVNTAMDDNTHLTPANFSSIFAIATKSSFSCESVPLKTVRKLYILGLQRYWDFDDYDLERMEMLAQIEKDFGYEIFVAKTYRKDLRDDSEMREAPTRDGIIRTSQIRDLLTTLNNASRD